MPLQAAQDKVREVGKSGKSDFPFMVIFAGQGYNLPAKQLKLHLEERTSNVKQGELFSLIMLMDNSSKSHTLFSLKVYTKLVFHMASNMLKQIKTCKHLLDLFAP